MRRRPERAAPAADRRDRRAHGTTPRTIRYYEEIGLLPIPRGREPGAHRTYEPEDVKRLRELLDLKSLLGITLEELRELAAAESARAALRREWRAGIEDPDRRREVLSEALEHVGRQLDLVRGRRDSSWLSSIPVSAVNASSASASIRVRSVPSLRSPGSAVK
jgi:MerR family transcriptional regulator, repressor of the yfmOP operon